MSRKPKRRGKDSRSSDKYVGNQFMIGKVMAAANAATKPLAFMEDKPEKNATSAAQLKRERKQARRLACANHDESK